MTKENVRPQTGADLGLDGFWADAEVISAYTVQDAVDDGLLVDGQAHPELGEVTRQHCGGRPVYLSRNLFDTIERSANNKRVHTDWKGIWHDVLSMSWVARLPVDRVRAFEVIIVGAGRKRKYRLWVKDQPDGLYFMFPGDD